MGSSHKWFYPKFGHELSIEAYSFKDARHTMLSFGFDRSDSSIRFAIGIWRLFCLFFAYEGKFAPQWRKGLPFNHQAREFSLRIFDGALWIVLWENPDGWSRDSRQWTIRPMDILFGKMKLDKVLLSEPLDDVLQMPEKAYDITVEVWRYTYWRPRLPFWRDVIQRISIECEEGIPFPGKGENSWDLDDDASFSFSGPAQSIADAVAKWKALIIRDRVRYGGLEWEPDAS